MAFLSLLNVHKLFFLSCQCIIICLVACYYLLSALFRLLSEETCDQSLRTTRFKYGLNDPCIENKLRKQNFQDCIV